MYETSLRAEPEDKLYEEQLPASLTVLNNYFDLVELFSRNNRLSVPPPPLSLSQAAPLEPADSYQRCRDEQHGDPPTAEHDQVRLSSLQLHPGSVLPATRPGGKAGNLSRVPGQWTLRDQHGAGNCLMGIAAWHL